MRSGWLGAATSLWLCACTTHRTATGDEHPFIRPANEMGATVLDAAVAISLPMDAAMAADAGATTGMSPSEDGAVGAPSDAALDGDDDEEPSVELEPYYGEVIVEVTTKPSGISRYEPRNLLAIWVEDDSGTPIKVLARWGASRASALLEYTARIGTSSWLGGGTQLITDVDTISGATLRAHELHVVHWDMTDHLGQRVPEATYTIVLECTDNLMESYVTTIALTYGPDFTIDELGETPNFGPIKVTYSPPPLDASVGP